MSNLEAITAPLATMLHLSQSVSPWLYLLGAVGLVVWGGLKVLGRTPALR